MTEKHTWRTVERDTRSSFFASTADEDVFSSVADEESIDDGDRRWNEMEKWRGGMVAMRMALAWGARREGMEWRIEEFEEDAGRMEDDDETGLREGGRRREWEREERTCFFIASN
uniref:Uncharacterized protein n=1 Tax=Pristionchus pacificus TaxID=54126 RepID=A0A2A6D2M7_PRIPA|eukprot:PDM84684.1 hypothetical protein PRIPAC_33707 [Pristionchus pacificus]